MVTARPWNRFWLLWVLANTLGWMSYTIVVIFPFFRSLSAVIIGLLIGALQWAVLSRYFEIDSLWVWASVIPYGILLFIVTLFAGKLGYWPLLLVEAAAMGVLGYYQCTILRNYVNLALVWLVASPLALVVGTMISRGINHLVYPRGEGALGLVWMLTGLIYGCITGATLILLDYSEGIDGGL